MSEKICTVNDEGNFTFIVDGILPENVPKVKHPPRDLHEDYLNYLKKSIEERVAYKKLIIDLKKQHEKDLKKLNQSILLRYKRNISKWFDV